METKTKHLPHVAVMKKKYELNKRDILARLEMSAEAYHILQFNTAIAWIRAKVWKDEEVVSWITGEPQFWNWWINQWNIRDDAFIHEYFEGFIDSEITAETLRIVWFDAHCIGNITAMLPDSVIRDLFKNACALAK